MWDYIKNVIFGGARCPYCNMTFTLQEWRTRDKESGGHLVCRTEPKVPE